MSRSKPETTRDIPRRAEDSRGSESTVDLGLDALWPPGRDPLLQKILEIHLRFFETSSHQNLFKSLLDTFLEFTGSQHGVISEVQVTPEGRRYLKVRASSLPSAPSTPDREANPDAPQGNLHPAIMLLDQILDTGQRFTVHHPPPETGPGDPGNPPLDSFLGLPLMHRNKLIGAVGLANSPRNFDEKIADYLQPLLLTCANLIVASQVDQGRFLAEKTLFQRNQQLKAILDSVVDGIITIDEKGTIQAFNKAAERIFGYKSLEVIGKNIKLLMPESYASKHDFYLRRYQEDKIPRIIGIGREVEGRRKDGTTFPLSLGISEMVSGEHKFYIGITRDISETKHAAEIREQLASIVENTEDAILGIDLDGIIFLWNGAARKIFGYMETEIIGKPLTRLIPADHKAESDYIREKIKRGETLKNFETQRLCKDGHIIDVSLTISPIRNERGQVTGFSTIERNISKQKKLLREKEELIRKLEEVTLKDPLTGLFNRRGLMERLDYEMARFRRRGRPFSLIMADLDNFKRINDRLGHNAGDEALQHISLLLRGIHRTTDTVCRWGGEEFLILLMETDLRGACFLAEHIRKTVEQSPITYNEEKITLTLSLGVTIIENPAISFETLIKEADECMYRAKKEGRNRVVFPDRFRHLMKNS